MDCTLVDKKPPVVNTSMQLQKKTCSLAIKISLALIMAAVLSCVMTTRLEACLAKYDSFNRAAPSRLTSISCVNGRYDCRREDPLSFLSPGLERVHVLQSVGKPDVTFEIRRAPTDRWQWTDFYKDRILGLVRIDYDADERIGSVEREDSFCICPECVGATSRQMPQIAEARVAALFRHRGFVRSTAELEQWLGVGRKHTISSETGGRSWAQSIESWRMKTPALSIFLSQTIGTVAGSSPSNSPIDSYAIVTMRNSDIAKLISCSAR